MIILENVQVVQQVKVRQLDHYVRGREIVAIVNS